MTKRKPPPQVVGGVRIIATAWKQVQDPEHALKETNANRLARAKFDQAMTTTDPAVRHAMLEATPDDGSAGAALLRYAHVILEDNKRTQSLRDHNEAKKSKTDRDAKHYRALAAEILSENPKLKPGTVAELIRKDLMEKGAKPPNSRTIERALKRPSGSKK
jgi:hypothetical protein